MKARILGIVLLFSLSLGGLLFSHLALSAQAEDIRYTETTGFGDPSAAKGLRAELTTSYRHQLFWETLLPFGNPAESCCSFSPTPRIAENRNWSVDFFPPSGGLIFHLDIPGNHLRTVEPQEFGDSFVFSEPADNSLSRCSSAVTESYAYFIPELRNSSGQLLDYSQTPGGYGVYRIPCVERPLTPEDLEMVLPLEETQRIVRFQVSADESELLLFSSGESGSRLQILDGETGAERQSLSLSFSPETLGAVVPGENCLLLFQKDSFTLLAKDQPGHYASTFTLPLSYLENTPFLTELNSVDQVQQKTAAAYGGKRLALMLIQDGGNTANISILDAQGLLYTGLYESSLFFGTEDVETDSFRLSWNGITLERSSFS